jgi:hypothetical protein
MLKPPANPNGTPMEAFDGIRAGVINDRSQFFKDLSVLFYGANREFMFEARIVQPTRNNVSFRSDGGVGRRHFTPVR